MAQETEQTTKVEQITEQMIQKYPKLAENHTKEDLIKVFDNVGGSWPIDFDEQYYQDVEILSKVLAETKVRVRYLRTGRYFPEDTEVRDIYAFSIMRENKPKIIVKFGASLQSTWNHERPGLYEVLTSIEADYTAGEYGTFEEFCDNLGYETDSRKAEKTYNAVMRQHEKLSRVFESAEILSFPR